MRDPQTARPRQPIPGRRRSDGNRLSGHAVFVNSLERQPEGNGSVEPFIRTLKEQLLWVRVFQNIEELRCALASRSSLVVQIRRKSISSRISYPVAERCAPDAPPKACSADLDLKVVISSKNSVPGCAVSINPGFAVSEPVKAPLS